MEGPWNIKEWTSTAPRVWGGDDEGPDEKVGKHGTPILVTTSRTFLFESSSRYPKDCKV
jgi:hypothetical protein